MLALPLVSQRGRRHRRHPADQQEEGPGEEALHGGRRAGAGHPVRRAQRGAPRYASRRKPASRSRTRILYDEIRRLFEGFVKASVEAIESRDPTTSGHSRRVADLTVGLAKVVDARDDRAVQRRVLLARGSARARVREPAPRLRQDRRAREGARQGEEALRRAARADSRALRLRRAVDRGRRARAQSSARSSAARARAISRALDAELARAARRRSTPRGTRSCTANEPTVLAQGEFEQIEEIARETFADLRGEVQTPPHARRDARPQREARLAHRLGVRRDPQRTSRTPSGSSRRSRGGRRSGACRSSPARTTSGSTARAIPNRLRAEEIPRAVEDDERRRHLRRADGERPSVQEGGADRARASTSSSTA